MVIATVNSQDVSHMAAEKVVMLLHRLAQETKHITFCTPSRRPERTA